MGLTVRQVSKSFGEKKAVDAISFSMEQPGVFGLIGTNGAGKTTTIRMILGMMSKDEGEILWDGKPFDRSPGAGWAICRRNGGFTLKTRWRSSSSILGNCAA